MRDNINTVGNNKLKVSQFPTKTLKERDSAYDKIMEFANCAYTVILFFYSLKNEWHYIRSSDQSKYEPKKQTDYVLSAKMFKKRWHKDVLFRYILRIIDILVAEITSIILCHFLREN